MKTAVIVLPTYNEAENIKSVVTQVFTAAKSIKNWTIKILVVDDNSPDKTADIVKTLQKKHKNLMLINGKKQGLGVAYIRGFKHIFKHTKAEVIFEMDADLSHPPSLIKEFLMQIDQGSDLVIGSRYIPNGATPDWGIVRKVISKGGNFFARIVAGLYNVHDCTSGFRAIKTDILKKLNLNKLGAKGYSFQMNLLYELIQHKAKISEVPLVFYDRQKGQSKMRINDLVEFFINSFHLRLRTWKRFVKFCIVGGSGVVVNTGILAALTAFAQMDYRIASIIAIEAAIIWNFFLNDKWTFKKSTNKSNIFTKLLKFNGVSLVGAAINWVVLIAITEGLGIYFIISNLVGILVATAWNYLANKKYTWRDA